MIQYEDFEKLDIRVARIAEAEAVEGSRKLLRLRVDLSEEQRQIIAGIGGAYEPHDLVGREIVVVVNLEPKTFLGLESQGMLLAADEEGGPVLLRPDKEVRPGAKIR